MIIGIKATPLTVPNHSATGVRFSVQLTTGQTVNTDVLWAHSLFDKAPADQVSRRIAMEVVSGFNSINDDINSTLTRN